MTDKKQPEALRLADWVESVVGGPHAKQCAAELRRLHAENESLRAGRERNLHSIRVCNEIINKELDENETLRTGYAAARLEIESLQARIKTMAEEHADELMVAHLDGRMQAAQPAGAQQPAPSAAVASKAMLAAIRAANMQLVRTGDDEFMLVTLKQATPQADSVLEDAARLDFIERHPEMSLRHRKGRWAFLGFTNYEYDLHQSLREAIDAAMAAQGGK